MNTTVLHTVKEEDDVHDQTLLPPIASKLGARRAPSPANSSRANSSASSRKSTCRASLQKQKTTASKAGLELLEYLQEEVLDIDEIENLLHTKETRDAVDDRDPSFGWTPLHCMANRGEIKMVKMLLDAKAHTDIPCNMGNTPLHLAARGNHPHVVDLLVARRAGLNCQNSSGWTALIWAAISGHDQVLPSLLSSGADLEILDKEGRNALMWAARHGYVKVMRPLLARAPDLDLRDLTGLTAMDHAKKHRQLRRLLRPVIVANKALLEAARCDDIDGVLLSLEEGAFVNARDSDGASPLGWAATNDSIAMVRLLLFHGADRHLADWRPDPDGGWSFDSDKIGNARDVIRCALHISDRLVYAAKDGDLLGVQEALQAGARTTTTEPGNDLTSLAWAVLKNNPNIILELYSANADIEARDAAGWTAVHSAVINGKAEALSGLYCCKAELDVRTWEGDFPLHLAARSGDWHMLQLLHVAKNDLEAVDAEGFTCLQLAVTFGQPMAISTLLALMADPEVKARRKRSLFHLAVVHGNAESARVLVSPVEPPKHMPGTIAGERGVDEEEEAKGPKKTKGKKGGPKLTVKRGSMQPTVKRGSVQPASPKGLDTKQKLRRATVAVCAKTNLSKKGGSDDTIHEIAQQAEKAPGKENMSVNGEGCHDKHETHVLPEHSPHKGQEEDKPDSHHVQDAPCSTANTTQGSFYVSECRGHEKRHKDASSSGQSTMQSFYAEGAEEIDGLILKAERLRESLPWSSPSALTANMAMKEEDADGRCAMALAIKWRQVAIVTLLIELQADVSWCDTNGITVLMRAAAWGNNFVVEDLLSAKAAIEAKDKEGRTAIQHASNDQVRQTLKKLLDSILVARHCAAVAASPQAKKMAKARSTPAIPSGKKNKKAPPGKDTYKGPYYRLRLENLPVRLPMDILENQIRTLLRRRGEDFNPARVAVPVHPITQRPLGHAYLDFKDEQKVDLLAQGGGEAVFGGADGWDFSKGVGVVKELPVTDTKDLY